MEAQNSHFKIWFVRAVVLFVVALYLVSPVYLFQHIKHMHGGHTMPIQDCSYFISSSTICDMALFDRLSSWQNTELVILSPFNLILLFALGIFFLSLVYFPPPLLRLSLYLKRQQNQAPNILYQELFSQGILNSKAY